MKRRDFLKSCGVAIGLATTPVIATGKQQTALPPEDPAWVAKKERIMGPALVEDTEFAKANGKVLAEYIMNS